MPTCAYAVNNILVEKDGTVVYDERTDQDTIEAIIIALAAAGFQAETGTEENEGPTGVAIQMPLSIFTESQLQNLYDLVAAKGSLIKKALGVSELPINIEGKKLDFPWFPKYESPDEVKAYMHFVTALCDMARNQKRITAKEKPVDNDKYAFRLRANTASSLPSTASPFWRAATIEPTSGSRSAAMNIPLTPTNGRTAAFGWAKGRSRKKAKEGTDMTINDACELCKKVTLNAITASETS